MSEETGGSVEKRDIPVNIEDIMHTAYLQYSLSVNVGRAIPDVRDGLKPCNRRILFAMRQLGLVKSRPHMKSCIPTKTAITVRAASASCSAKVRTPSPFITRVTAVPMMDWRRA